MMAPLSRFFDFAKHLFQRTLANDLFCFGRNFKVSVRLFFLQVSLIFQVLNEIANAIVVVGDVVFIVQLC